MHCTSCKQRTAEYHSDKKKYEQTPHTDTRLIIKFFFDVLRQPQEGLFHVLGVFGRGLHEVQVLGISKISCVVVTDFSILDLRHETEEYSSNKRKLKKQKT
jgi:hypothetical protein